jgi:hypothetical protein
MNKIYSSLVLTLLTTTTFAQIKFAPEVGINMGMQTIRTLSQTSSSPSFTESSKLSPGFTGGLNLDIKILRNLYVNTGTFYVFDNIKYSQNKDLTKYGLGNPESISYSRLHYIKVPLYIMYKSGFEGMGRFTAGVGMYTAYAIGGNSVQSIPDATYDMENDKYSLTYKNSNTEMKFGDDPLTDNLRRWDYGINACMGYESNIGLYFRGTVNYGLVNLDPANISDKRIRNWGFGLSIGYLIGKDNW